MPFPILMYHALRPVGPSPPDPVLDDPDAGRYAIAVETFERHVRAIVAAGRTTPRDWSEIDRPQPDTVWITFDDGHRSCLELALPLLDRYGLRALVFVTTDWIGTTGYLDADGLRTLHRAGILLGTHGCSHRLFSDLSETELRRELAESKQRLETILGEPVPALALPGGRTHRALRAAARELGYRHVFGSGCRLAQPDGDPFDWPRIALMHSTPPDLVERTLAGDLGPLRAMARAEARRRRLRALIGDRFYRALRRRMLGR